MTSSSRDDGTSMTAPIVADIEEVNDDSGDSAVNLSINSSSASISSSILQYRTENGRTYHSYKAGKYVLPNDETENDRLDLQHHIFMLTLDGRLHDCPAGKDGKTLHRVLDLGTGTGIWALDFADEHSDSHVIGVDLSPIQPSFVPPNLSYFVDDVEEEWTFSSKFDLIYCRMLTGAIADWPRLFKRAFNNLNPGGWFEVTDIVFPPESDDDTLSPESNLSKWAHLMVEAGENLGRSIRSALLYKTQLEAAGFTNVVATRYKWPQNTWPKDKKFKEIGLWTEHNVYDGISGLSMALFTRGLGWSSEQLEVYLAAVRKDVRSRQIHAYWPIYVVYGQKPE